MAAARRRVHNKSRAGCAACKQQRKKCDERKPICGNCERREIKCSLEYLTVRAKFEGKPPPTAQVTLRAEPGLLGLDLGSLELLHHYTSVASLTLSAPRRQAIWQIMIPQLAFANNFLMHGILAVSALHLAHLQPIRRKELMWRAALSEHVALSSYRQFNVAEDPSTVHAALAFGTFVIPYVLALSGVDETPARLPTIGDNTPHWFFLVRGVLQLVAKTWPALKRGPFGPMLVRHEILDDYSVNPDDGHLCKLYELLDGMEASEFPDGNMISAYRDTLQKLRRMAAVPYSKPMTLDIRSTIYIWPGSLSDEFMVLLHERRPEALVILAHYCVILKKMDYCWYLKNIGRKMLTVIEETLDPSWQPWIEWPVQYPSNSQNEAC